MVKELKDFQLSFFGGIDPNYVVNVASVKQLSPFRYPGGKTWLIPRVRQWCVSFKERPAQFRAICWEL